MSGRLRVVVIEADGESAQATIEAAMQLLAPREAPALPPAPAARHEALEPPADPAPQGPPRGGRGATRRKPQRRPRTESRSPAEGGAAADSPARSGSIVENAGITVDLTPGGESISFGDQLTELTDQQAELAALLVRTSPTPVDRAFLIKRLKLTGEWADQQLVSRAGRLRDGVVSIGLEVVSARGVGIAIRPKEG